MFIRCAAPTPASHQPRTKVLVTRIGIGNPPKLEIMRQHCLLRVAWPELTTKISRTIRLGEHRHVRLGLGARLIQLSLLSWRQQSSSHGPERLPGQPGATPRLRRMGRQGRGIVSRQPGTPASCCSCCYTRTTASSIARSRSERRHGSIAHSTLRPGRQPPKRILTVLLAYSQRVPTPA